jgi:tRNA nucleotidyltransferase (CCA-adding enzyme)
MSNHQDLGPAFAAAYPDLTAMAAAAPDPVYLVGGAVRDLLLKRGRADIDLVVEGDPGALADALGAEPLAAHERFGTLKVRLAGEEIDIATARRETYARPGALPTVELGVPIRTDLARRDFTVNAMAVPLAEPRELIDPYDGQADLERGVLRVLHDASFVDDPTRAIRAARYAARFELKLEERTEELLRATDLGTVSLERRAGELRRLAEEATGVKGLKLLAGWGLVQVRAGGLELAGAVDELLSSPAWAAEVDRAEAILAAALGPAPDHATPPDADDFRPPAVSSLASAHPSRPSEGVALARGHDAIELVLARAAGAGWLDDWLTWREVKLEISGADLTAAGISGPAVGVGLEAALAAKLDGAAPTRPDELRVALAVTDTDA